MTTTAELYEQRVGPIGQTAPQADGRWSWSWLSATTSFRFAIARTLLEAARAADQTALLQRLAERTLQDDGLDWEALEQARASWG